jgi:UDP-glucose 4-epimerase
VYGDVHRFEAYGEQVADFALTESTYSASKIAGEAFVYSYARCYGLRYLVFRFSNVYGRFDNDLDRMVRVIPLFIHSMLRDEPITVFGGNAKTLDFTYIDDCVEGVVRGIESLVDGTVVNQTINLAYGQGNTLVHCAERIAAELGVRPRMTMAPSLLGEVTHYVADLSKAREFLDYDPQVALDVGIQRAVAWFREHRDSHPEEDGPVTAHYEATSRALQIERADDLAQRRRRERADARVIEPEAAPGTRSAHQA